MSGSKKNINDQIAALRTLLGKNDEEDALSFLQDDDQNPTDAQDSVQDKKGLFAICLLYTSPSPRDRG